MNRKICFYFYFFLAFSWIACSNQSQNHDLNTADQLEDDPGQEQELQPGVQVHEESNILFFGNSLTAGLGLEEEEEAFPALIQKKIDALDLPYHCINAGLSGETSAGGKERIEWLLQEPVDVFVLELGANDGLRGIDVKATFENLSAIIEHVLAVNPDCKVIVAGMKVPPNMGQDYFTRFEEIYPKLQTRYQTYLIPFLLEDIAGIPELNQRDGIHPTAAGQQIMADHVWKVLKSIL